MAGIYEVIGLALAMTIGFACVGFTLYALFTNPIYKVKLMRYIQPKRAWGFWFLVLPGKQVVFNAVPFANDDRAFKAKGDRVFPVAEEERIYSFGRAPIQVNNDKDAKALSLETPAPTQDIRDPGKLGAYTQLYEAKADAKARRKLQFNPKQFVMLLAAVGIIALVSVYYGYSNHDLLTQLAPGAKAAIDNPGNLLGGVVAGHP